MSHPNYQSWRLPPPHGATATMSTDAAPLGTIPWDPQLPEIWACAGHMGSTDWRLLPDDTDVDQYHRPDLFLYKSGIQHVVSADNHNSSGRRAGGSVPGRPGPTPEMDCSVDTLPRDYVVICEVVIDRKKTPIVGTYLPPSTLGHLLDLDEALSCFRDQNSIMLGDISAGIGTLQNPRSQQVPDLMMEFRLMDLLNHF